MFNLNQRDVCPSQNDCQESWHDHAGKQHVHKRRVTKWRANVFTKQKRNISGVWPQSRSFQHKRELFRV